MAEPNPNRVLGPDDDYCHRLLPARRISFAPEGLAGIPDCAAIGVALLLSDSRPRQPAGWCHSSRSSEFDNPCAVFVGTVNSVILKPEVIVVAKQPFLSHVV